MKISNLIKIKQRKLGGNGLSHTFVLFSKHGTHVQMVYCSLYYVFVYGEEPGCRLKLVCITCVCFYLQEACWRYVVVFRRYFIGIVWITKFKIWFVRVFIWFSLCNFLHQISRISVGYKTVSIAVVSFT